MAGFWSCSNSLGERIEYQIGIRSPDATVELMILKVDRNLDGQRFHLQKPDTSQSFFGRRFEWRARKGLRGMTSRWALLL
jgi:hypothetical protein